MAAKVIGNNIATLVSKIWFNFCFIFNLIFSWLKQYGVLTEGEGQLRRQQKFIIDDNMSAEYLPFSFPDEINGGVEIRQAPSVSVQSLSRKVFKQLDEYDK